MISSGVIYDELLIEKELNMTLPPWVAITTMNRLAEAYSVKWNVTFVSDDVAMKRILGGNLLWTITDNMLKRTKTHDSNTLTDNDDENNKFERLQLYTDRSPSKKIYLYSAVNTAPQLVST